MGKGAQVPLATFTARIRGLASRGALSDLSIEDALLLSVAAYRRKYAVRKTYVEVEGERLDMMDFYVECAALPKVSYRVFWQRAKSLLGAGRLTRASLTDASSLENKEWITSYGGGRRRGFVYEGEAYPELSGQSFSGVSSMLLQIGRFNDRSLVWARLKSGWTLDDALTIGVASGNLREGSIYLVKRKKTGQVYVGLTCTTVEQRWSFHIQRAKQGATTPLAQAIREDAPDGFDVSVLESGVTDTDVLKQREIYWVDVLDAMWPRGLNRAKAGGLGGGRGIKTEVDGVTYRSLQEAAVMLARAKNLPIHVVRSRLVEGKPIPVTARKHSDHEDAGTNLFRRWLGMLKRHGNDVCASWRESYDSFKADVSPVPSNMELIRTDPNKPWTAMNVEWVDVQEKMERAHGVEVVVDGVRFSSIKKVAEHYGIGASTLKDRLKRQGMSIERAVSASLGTTSCKKSDDPITVDGKQFRSKNQAIRYIAETRGITEHQAKYRFNLGRY